MSPSEINFLLAWWAVCALVSFLAHCFVRRYEVACLVSVAGLAVLAVVWAVVDAAHRPGLTADGWFRLLVNVPFAAGWALFIGGPTAALIGVPFHLLRKRG